MQVLDPADPTGKLSDIKAVSAGFGHSLALKDDGTVWAWGEDSVGELGDGTNTLTINTPVQVTDPADPSGKLTGGSPSPLAIDSLPP